MPTLSLNASKKTKHTPAGEIPVDWGCMEIGKLCSLSNGTGFGPTDWTSEGLPIIRIQNLNGSADFNYFSGTPKDSWIVEPGDLLFAWAGTRGASFGPTIWAGPRGVLNQHIFKVRPNAHVDPSWLYLSLRALTEEIEKKAHGFKSTLLHVGKKDITSRIVPVPPLPEQLRIAAILSTWDRAIETLESLVAAKDRRKQALMQQLLTGRTRLPGFEGKWKRAKLSDVFERVTRPINGSPEHVLSITAGKGFVDQRTKFSRLIAGKNLERYVLLQRGEFSYNKGNSDRYPQGCIYRLDEVDEGAVPNVYYSFRPRTAETDSTFFKHYFLAGMLNTQLTSIINAGVRNDGLLNVPAASFFNLLVSFPPKEEQIQLGKIFDTGDRELTLHRQHLEFLRTQKRGLMQKLLTGQVRVIP